MATNKPSIPKGTRDFSPVEMLRRNYIFNTIKEVYQLYGFEQIETPAMENLSTLLGKYGDEGDKLLFKILNSGDFLSKVDKSELSELDANKLSLKICERGLRYDLTVPFARYVVQHQNDITFPFRRYQIQPVWRADRPQKGRYREFYQCDADIIGSTSLINELELIQIIDEVFKRLDINVVIKINNRKILAGIAEFCGIKDKMTDFTIALDKLEKFGWEKVQEDFFSKGISQESVNEIRSLTQIVDFDNDKKIIFLKKMLMDSKIGKKGIAEVEELISLVNNIELKNEVELDLTLARGLNYYTGAIFEVKAKDVQIGSICGGGRYDDLTGIFGLKDISGVGISFGADRIYDVLLQLEKFPQETSGSTQVLFINFGEKEIQYCLPVISELRKNGIRTEIYPNNAKMKKQMGYANSKNIPYVVLVGENEVNNSSVTVKDMKSGEQETIEKDLVVGYFKG